MNFTIQNIQRHKNYNSFVGQNCLKSADNNGISFGSLSGKIAQVGNKLTKSSVHFSDYNIRKANLDVVLGGEFSKIEDELKGLSSKVFNFNKRIVFDDNGGVTFIEDGILPKFLKSALYPFKDLWLDVANWALRGMAGFKRVPIVSNFANNALNNGVLAKRAGALNAEELFCIMQGSFSDIAKNEKSMLKLKDKLARHIVERTKEQAAINLTDSPHLIVENMLHAASNIKGNYKTADERTLNRICTGMVSATIAGVDFYNISRMQNDDDALAKKSQKKRFKQESSRILMSAGMTFLTLGALSKYANANKYVALFTIGGTTLISEILSRLLNGMPLRPLKPDEAKDFAYHKHKKRAKNNVASKSADNNVSALPNDINSFIRELSKSQDDKTLKFRGVDKSKENATVLNLKNIAKVVGVLLGSGLAVCFARSRSDKFNTLLKNIRNGMDDAYNLITKKDFWVSYDEMLKIINKISDDYKMTECAQRLKDALQSNKYERVVRNINGNDVEFVKLGKVDKKVIAPLIKAITYPFGFIWGVIRFPIKITRGLFEKEASKNLSKVTSGDLMGIYKVYNKANNKLKNGKITTAEFDNYIKRKVLIAAENKTGKSTYKNSSLAAISRPLVTLIASYFFVNDYRNEVLITSGGKDVEGANAVAKERIMHKVSNFFFNSLLMNLFNSVFETAYHGSLLGAATVAAATEFTNENLIRKSIGVPTKKMTREEIIEHDRQNLERDDFWGKYFRFMSKITGKKTISQKVQEQEKKKAQKA